MWDLISFKKLEVSSLLWIIVSFVSVILLFMYYWSRRKLYQVAALLPGPPTLPIIGNIHIYIGKPVVEILNSVNYYTKDLFKQKLPMRLWSGPFLVICATRPEDCQIILNSPESFEKSLTLYNVIKIFIGNCMPMKTVTEWKPMRKALTPAFTKSMIENNVPKLNECCKKLMDVMKNKTIWEYPDMDKATLSVSTDCIVACQTRANFMTYDEYYSFGKKMRRCNNICFDRTVKFWLISDFLFSLTKDYQETQEIIKHCAYYKNKLIETRKQKRLEMKQEDESKCFLDILLDLSDEGKITEKDIFDDLSFMFSSGDTTGTCIYNILILLAIHQDVQNKLHDELYSIFGGSDRPIEAADLREMVYLDMIIKETLRILSEVVVLGRTTTGDLKLTECTIPSGTLVIMSPYLMHRHPEFWPEPNKFDPDRFLPHISEKRHPYSFLSFSGGPRNCIGYKFAIAVVKTVVATMIRKYSFKTDATMKDIEQISAFVGRYKCSRPVKIEEREVK